MASPRVTAGGALVPLSHALELSGRADGKHLIVNGMGTIRISIRDGKIIWAWLWEDPFGHVYRWQAQPLRKRREKTSGTSYAGRGEREGERHDGIWPNP